MHVVKLQSKQIGIVPIYNLEEGLKKRVQELGIQILYGEFQQFQDDKTKAVNILHDGKEEILPYDILVAADGAHSRVREALGVQCNIFGEVNGFSAFIPHAQSETTVGISYPIKTNGFFLRKIGFSTGSIIFAQRILDPHAKEAISEKEFQELLKSCHLNKECQSLVDGKADVLYNITITLQQVEQFSDEEKGAIIVGDAAATASFFKGMGANTALKTASLAGEFFSKIQQHDRDSYASFNLKIKEATDALINDSKFLFISE